MNQKDDFALVPKPPSGIEKAQPDTRRILSCMVTDTLALVSKEKVASPTRKFRIGDYEWREPDYQQILLWAKAMALEPREVIRRLLEGNECGDSYSDPEAAETTFKDGMLLKLRWDFRLLPLYKFDWVDGLAITHLLFIASFRKTPQLSLRMPSLRYLSCEELGLTELDLSGVPRLKKLVCIGNRLTGLNLTSVPLLTTLDCPNNSLTTLDLSGVPLLKGLRCGSNQLTELDLSGVPLLTSLSCNTNQLPELDLSGVPLLRDLWCEENQLTKLDLSGVPLLKLLACYKNELTDLDLSCLPLLEELGCGGNQLTELELSGVPLLKMLSCNENQIVQIDLSRVLLLERLSCYRNPIDVLDVRHLENLRELWYDVRARTRLIQRPDQQFKP